MKTQPRRNSAFSKKPHRMTLFLASFLTGVLLFSPLANAAYWIGNYTGDPREFSLTRDNQSLEIQAETLLNTGDKITVLSATGVMRLTNDDDDSEIVLDKDNASYVVPQSKEPPTLIKNLYSLVSEWLSQATSEKVQAKSLSTRGDEPVLLLGASDWKNLIPANSGELIVYWSGGKVPFQVRLTDSDDKVIMLKSDIEDNHVTLGGLELVAGEYLLKVLGKSSSSIIQLDVVKKTAMPSLYTDIIKSRAPQRIKNKFSVLALANKPDWIFHSLQLANEYGLLGIKERILHRDVPKLQADSLQRLRD